MGKGLTVIRNLQRKHYPDCRTGEVMQTSLREIAKSDNGEIPISDYGSVVSLRSQVRKNCTPGFVWGVPGNRHSYHDFPENPEAILEIDWN